MPPTLPPPHLRAVADSRQGIWFASDVGERLAEGGSESPEMIRMRRWDIIRILTQPSLAPLGLPLTMHMQSILTMVMVRGALQGDYWTWYTVRGAHTVNYALADELKTNTGTIAKAMIRLREHGFTRNGFAFGDKPSLTLLEPFHRWCFEAQWRELLYYTNMRLMRKLVRRIGWSKLLAAVDLAFTEHPNYEPKHQRDRQYALSYVQ